MSGAPPAASVRVEAVGTDDADLLVAWHRALDAAVRAEVGASASVWTLPELVVMMRTGVRSRVEPYVALVDRTVVGAGQCVLPLLDNLDAAEVDVAVPPAHRRRGYGTALLAHVEERCREEGRTRLDAAVAWPYDHGPDGAGRPGYDFAMKHGYRFGLGDVQRDLTGHVDGSRLDALAAAAAPHHAAYRLRAWTGPVPDDLVVGWLALQNTLMTEAPAGGMEREAEKVDVAAQRRIEAVQEAMGRRSLHVVALAPDGEVVAYSQLLTTVHEPGRAYQWGTLVHREHRGHRLGLAVKVANHRLLQRSAPGVTRVSTWNAEENEHMIEINDLLGFAPVARLGELQKRLRTLV